MSLNLLGLQAGDRREAASFSEGLLTRSHQRGRTAVRRAWANTRTNDQPHFGLLCSYLGGLGRIVLHLRSRLV